MLDDPVERQRRFLKLWTLKEAYLKAVGRGISGFPGLAGFSVDPRPAGLASVSQMTASTSTAWAATSSAHAVRTSAPAQPAAEPGSVDARQHMLEEEVHFVPPEGVNAGEWRFALMQPTARHVAAVCLKSRDQAEQCQEESSPIISAWEVLPLAWDRGLGLSTIDASPGRMAVLSKL